MGRHEFERGSAARRACVAGGPSALTPRQRKLQRVLWTGYLALWGVCAVAPVDRSVWLLENVLVVLVFAGALLLRRRFSLSSANLTACCLFFALHAIGAHYTYSEVPYARAVEAWLGLSSQRNAYDRLVHFAAGLLVTGSLRELSSQALCMSEAAARYFALTLAMALSLVYELIEWAAAELFGGGTGALFLGTQGDVWDAQKDMALASLGAVLATFISLLRSRRGERPL